MNLLFYTSFKISPTKGGTEHTTLTVAKQLHEHYNCKCWAFHCVDATTPDCDCFEKQYFVNGKHLKEGLLQIIQNNHIDVVLSEGGFEVTICVDEIRTEHDLKVKNIFVHHFTPGWEENFGTKINYIENFKDRRGLRKIKALIKLLLYPYFRHRYLKRLPKSYHNVYIAADNIVLLTKGYIPLFQEYGRFKDDKKFKVIPNALSLPDILEKKDYDKVKNKIVLVIARLEEIQKRISLVLKIWEQASKDKLTEGWELLIGGEGIYRKQYEQYVEEHKIKNIKFLGRVDPIPYYTEASIFMMTSRSEGFPLTLNEAMQYGVVPLAFDSFESIRDIINDGQNGFIIPELDIKTYVDKLLWLIENPEKRRSMAFKGIDSSLRYKKEKITVQWHDLLTQLTLKKEDTCATIILNTPPTT